MTACPRPEERARTITCGVASAALTLPDGSHVEVVAHAADAEGRPVLLARADGPVVRTLAGWPDSDMPAALEVTDLAPVPLADRVRGRVWLSGWVSEVPESEREAALRRVAEVRPLPEPFAGAWRVLRMDIAELDLVDGWGAADVDVDAYQAARPDPLATEEPSLMRHLDTAHRRELTALCARVDALTGACDPRALGVDRYGLWVRVTLEGRAVNVRFAFPEPVADAYGLQVAYRALLHYPGTAQAISRP